MALREKRLFAYLYTVTCISLIFSIWYTNHVKNHSLNVIFSYKIINDAGEEKDVAIRELGFYKSPASVTPHRKYSLVVDTPGCKIPNLDPFDPTVKDLYQKVGIWDCSGPPLFLKTKPHGALLLNESVLQAHYGIDANNIACIYQPILRMHHEDMDRENYYQFGNISKVAFDEPLRGDHIGVTCEMGIGSGNTFQHFFPLVHLKSEIEERKIKNIPPHHQLNVILVGIDSVSRLNSLRHMSRTRAFLQEKMQPFEMKGYTKVGDNTFPNLIPLLTGHFVEQIFNESLKDEFYFDDVDIIWKDYAKRGYRTFYAEDSPFSGTFNYLKRGFYNQPTDYYFRTLAIAYENSDLRKRSKELCLNSQLETELLFDYLRDFTRTMDNRPYFAFAMISTLTHDYLNNAGYADDPTVRLLEDLWDNGALNRSVLIMFSDHGLRFGRIRERYIGKIEERMPFMFIHMPKWFLDLNPRVAGNLKTNQERLVTLFDINATMRHLLNFHNFNASEDPTRHGRSLLEEISRERTCEDANIHTHWCTCQNYQKLDVKDEKVSGLAQAIVSNINQQLEPYSKICAKLEIDDVVDAQLGLVNDQILKFVKVEADVINGKIFYGNKLDNVKDYLITLRTRPGGAMFEGSVRYNDVTIEYNALGISRINMYGNQSHCIDSQKMKLYCYCIDLL